MMDSRCSTLARWTLARSTLSRGPLSRGRLSRGRLSRAVDSRAVDSLLRGRLSHGPLSRGRLSRAVDSRAVDSLARSVDSRAVDSRAVISNFRFENGRRGRRRRGRRRCLLSSLRVGLPDPKWRASDRLRSEALRGPQNGPGACRDPKRPVFNKGHNRKSFRFGHPAEPRFWTLSGDHLEMHPISHFCYTSASVLTIFFLHAILHTFINR